MSVDAGVTTSLAGNPNTAAYQVIKYRPPSTAVTSVSHTANVVIGATIAASLGSSLLAGSFSLLQHVFEDTFCHCMFMGPVLCLL